jgi:cellulose synthase (UDP-forming)
VEPQLARVSLPPLPYAPTAWERVLYVGANNRLLSVTQLIGWLGLSAALFLFSLNSIWLFPFMVWVLLGVAYFSLGYLANTTFRRFDLAEHDRLVAEQRRPSPSIDVFLPNCGEELAVLETTFAHVASLEHAGRVRVYCLDDAGRAEVEQLADRFGFVYLSRPNKGEFKKAGNLRHAYLRSDGEFIVVFDADFCPRPDFLAELLPYALSDPSVGIVQSPQYFRVGPGRNWLENGAGSVQEFFYRWVMPARDVRRSPICVGTNAIYRRSALEETDGGALVENSEDVHTGFDLMCKGYRTKYVPVILAAGLCPNSLQTFFNQQHRWCSGSMSLLFSRKFWHEPIGLRARLTFLSGMTYFLYTALAVIVAPLPAPVMVCLFPGKVLWWNYLLLLPTLLQTFVFLPLWHRAPYGFAAMRTKIVYAWAHLFAFRDRLARRPLAWSPTGGPDRGTSRRLRLVKTLIVGWPLATLSLVVAGSAAHMSSAFDFNYWPPLAASSLYTLAAVLTLQPLRDTVPAESRKLLGMELPAAPNLSPGPFAHLTPAMPTPAGELHADQPGNRRRD